MTSARRDAGRPRGAPVEQAILAATLAELAAHGPEGLSVPRVAAAAGVNKTSVYRRWPTREALVAAALEAALHETAGALRDTGSLRGDLELLIGLVAERVGTPEGRALARAALDERADAAVGALALSPVAREPAEVIALVQRACARREWDLEQHPPEAVLALIAGGVLHRVLLERQPVSPAWAASVAALIARGLAPAG